METSLADAIGTVAGALTTLSFIPQVIKTRRSRSTADLSLAMFSAFCLGVALWLVYGWMVRAWPVILANMATLIMAGYILLAKIRHVLEEKGRPPARGRPS